jgi:glycosyltransferase involved in cell wall biosynthesis
MAFEHGVPAIATRVGGFPEQIREGVDGLLADPGDAESLREAIVRFYEDPGRYRAGVRRPDPEPAWELYLRTLTAAGR